MGNAMALGAREQKTSAFGRIQFLSRPSRPIWSEPTQGMIANGQVTRIPFFQMFGFLFGNALLDKRLAVFVFPVLFLPCSLDGSHAGVPPGSAWDVLCCNGAAH